ncbi:MAG: AAA family ATPase [Verrucomicrobiia bacterium]
MNDTRPKITEVFTPRSAEVNPKMYIDRPTYERELERAVEGSKHAILCGESGGGKSWLYRHVSEREGWKTFYANAGNAARHKTVTGTIANAVFEEGDGEWTEYTQALEGNIKVLGIGGSAETERKFEVKSKELLLRTFKKARERADKQVAVVVIDNLEAIFGKADLMEELGNVILLLDDPDYAQYKIKLLIVGVPAEVVEYYQRIDNLEPVANRLTEIPSVTGLNWGQIEDFVRRGFSNQLKVGFVSDQVKEIARHVEFITLGIAQRLHEYCEILAFNIQDSGWKYDSGLLDIADQKFLSSCLKKAYAVVDAYMNERRTKAGRRNQVLFSLGKLKNSEFDINEVEEIVRSEFPVSTSNTALAIGQMMADLAAGNAPLLRRTTKGASYRFADPRYLMCIRVMLKKSGNDEKVVKATWRR